MKWVNFQILRSCPDVASIYVLGREKKGHSLQQRFTDIFNSALFDRVRKENPTAIEKVRERLSKLDWATRDRIVWLNRINKILFQYIYRREANT